MSAIEGWLGWGRRFRPSHLAALAAAVAGTVGAMAGVPTGIAASMVAATMTVLVTGAVRRRRARHRLRQVSRALRLFARELAAGGSVPAAVAAVSASERGAADLLTALAVELEVHPPGGASPAVRPRHPPAAGAGRSKSLAILADPTLGPVVTRLRAGWSMSLRHGIPLAAVVRAIGDEVDHRRSAADRRSAQTAGPALSGYLLAGLPFAGLMLGTAMGARPVLVLTSSALGGVLLVVGTALSCAGLLWSTRLAAL
jgi:tight adherence protein B